jgi:hypothetical protein
MEYGVSNLLRSAIKKVTSGQGFGSESAIRKDPHLVQNSKALAVDAHKGELEAQNGPLEGL